MRHRLMIWGNLACFSRPEMKVERVSYSMLTPSAARGALEAILWKPQMRWRIERIDRLRPVQTMSVRRNEVTLKASPDRAAIIADDPNVRAQRATLLLRDVAYTIHARIELTPKADRPDDTLVKYDAMFVRRAGAGQCYQRPCLGMREFAADFRLLEANETDPTPEDAAPSESLGWILYDLDWSTKPPQPRFFDARLEHGRMTVPPPSAAGIRA